MQSRSTVQATESRHFGHCISDLSARVLGAIALVFTMAVVVEAQIPTDGLVGYWKANNSAVDSSPVANNGSFPGSYVPGRPGRGAAFDLASSVVTSSHNAAYNFQSYAGWTVGFWFNANGTNLQSNGTFLGQDNGSGFKPKWFVDYGYTVFGPTSTFVLHFNDFNQERIFIQSDSVPPPTGWNQLAVVVNNEEHLVTFYLNGTSIGTRGLPSYVLATTAPLVFGLAEPGLTYRGLFDDVTIYNRALAHEEVIALATVPPACTVDANGDQVVNTLDLIVLLRAFGGAGPAGDLNGDGVVNSADLAILLAAFGQTCG